MHLVSRFASFTPILTTSSWTFPFLAEDEIRRWFIANPATSLSLGLVAGRLFVADGHLLVSIWLQATIAAVAAMVSGVLVLPGRQ